jgi:hypothetical protein
MPHFPHPFLVTRRYLVCIFLASLLGAAVLGPFNNLLFGVVLGLSVPYVVVETNPGHTWQQGAFLSVPYLFVALFCGIFVSGILLTRTFAPEQEDAVNHTILGGIASCYILAHGFRLQHAIVPKTILKPSFFVTPSILVAAVWIPGCLVFLHHTTYGQNTLFHGMLAPLMSFVALVAGGGAVAAYRAHNNPSH